MSSFPAPSTPALQPYLLSRVAQGQAQVTWADVTSTVGAHTGVFRVMADALRLDGVRINVSAATQQGIADLLGCSLLTAKLADLAYAQRQVTLCPFPRPIAMTTASMVEHSAKIDAALSKLGPVGGLIQTVGKHWIIDNELALHPGRAMNYGWHFQGASFQSIQGEVVPTLMKQPNGQYQRLIQGRGTAHDIYHVDYSQTCVLVQLACTVDGQAMSLLDVFADPALAPLVSHQGVLKVTRQPGTRDRGDRASAIEV